LTGVKGGAVTTWLTNNANGLTPGTIRANSLELTVGTVPARSSMSFVLSDELYEVGKIQNRQTNEIT